MQLKLEKHNFCKLESIANVKNHLEKLKDVKIDGSKATGELEINVSYSDKENLECFKVLNFGFDLDLKDLKILEINIGYVGIYLVEGQGLDINYELVVNYLEEVNNEQAIEIEPIKEENIEISKANPTLDEIKEEMKEYYEDILADNLKRDDNSKNQIIQTKSHQSVASFLDFFDKQGYCKIKCLYVENQEELSKLSKEYKIDLKTLQAGYDEQTNKVIFTLP